MKIWNIQCIIFVFQIKNSKVHILVRTCLHRSMSERTKSSDCPTDAQLSVNTSTPSVLQDSVVVPYPKAGTWFITLSMSCFTGINKYAVLTMSIGPLAQDQ